MPPAYLQVLVSGFADDAWFLQTGADNARSVRYVFSKAGRPVESLERFLDFGCGCGHVTRHLIGLGPAIEGCDYNSTLVSWCRKHLNAATFTTNALRPPTSYPDGHFDGILALSVMTHLTVHSQQAWLAEWRRLLAPGGLLLFTAHGQRFRECVDGRGAHSIRTRRDRCSRRDQRGVEQVCRVPPAGLGRGRTAERVRVARPHRRRDRREDPERWNFGQDAYLLRRRPEL